MSVLITFCKKYKMHIETVCYKLKEKEKLRIVALPQVSIVKLYQLPFRREIY